MSIAENKHKLESAIAGQAEKFGHDPGRVRLIAVSKQQPGAGIAAALEAGQRIFGENRVQEARQRWEMRRSAYPELELHLLGPLQTNKVKEAAALFDVIHTLDRPKLADRLADEMARQGRDLPCFIQVNTGAEPQKSGIPPDDVEEMFEFAKMTCGIDVRGLMCIPPADRAPGAHFALLAKKAEELGLPWLSMGMSGDYETAAALGATHIRIGTAFFGAREG